MPKSMNSTDPRLPAPVRERWKIVDERALAKVIAIHDQIGPERQMRFDAYLNAIVQSTEAMEIRLRALYELADAHLAYYRKSAACRRGCSHCCYTAVALTKPEAEMLGAQIKRKPKQMSAEEWKAGSVDQFKWGYHNPCTFLQDGACSIYEHRPLNCRVHYNMDDDDLLCRLDIPGAPVPLVNVTRYHVAYLAICGFGLADIRAFFPREPSESPI